jgi:hypothetical protein
MEGEETRCTLVYRVIVKYGVLMKHKGVNQLEQPGEQREREETT